MAKKKRVPKKEKKELKIYKGGYLVAEKNKEKAEDLAESVSDREDKIMLLHPKKEVSVATARRSVIRDRKPLRIHPKAKVSVATARRSVIRDRKPLRITPKRPKLRR